MKGRLFDISLGMNQKQRITFELDEDFSEQYAEYQERELDISVKPYRKRRSLDCNALAWVLIDKIAARQGLTKTEVYREAIRNIGGVSTIVCVPEKAAPRLCDGWSRQGIGWQTETMPSKIKECVNVTLYYGSSVYDQAQMSALIDRLVHEAQSLNIPTETPEQIARYKDLWGR